MSLVKHYRSRVDQAALSLSEEGVKTFENANDEWEDMGMEPYDMLPGEYHWYTSKDGNHMVVPEASKRLLPFDWERKSTMEVAAKPKETTKDINPKDAIGVTKVPLSLLSPIAKAHWASAQFLGDCKYQQWNWRASNVRASVYLSAAMRHLDAYNSGEETDPVDGTHHLGNAMACCAILLDAAAAGVLIDDRPPKVDMRLAYEAVERTMKACAQRYSHIPRNPYTILNTVVKPLEHS
jgi:hypothetical protein